jgi:thioredoxin-like negative regulator of GroEL
MFTNWYRSKSHRRPPSLYGNLIAYMQLRLNQQPDDQKLRLSLVKHLEMAGRYEEAIDQTRHLLQHHPDNLRAKGMLIRLRLEQRLTGLRRIPA